MPVVLAPTSTKLLAVGTGLGMYIIDQGLGVLVSNPVAGQLIQLRRDFA